MLSDLGQPVLCGLADAGLVDPPHGQSGGFDPAADVGALADVLASVLAPAEGLRRWSAGVAGLLRRADERSMEQLAAELATMAQPPRPPLRRSAADTSADSPAIDLTETAAPTSPTVDLTDTAAPPPPTVDLVDAPAPASPTVDPRHRPADRSVVDDQVAPGWLDEAHLEDHPFWADPPEREPDPLSLGDASTVDQLFAPVRSFGPQPPRHTTVAPRRWSVRRLSALAGLALLAVVAGATTVAALSGSGSSPSVTDRTPEAAIGEAPAPAPAPQEGEGVDGAATTLVPAACPLSHDEAAVVGVPATCADRLMTAGNRVSVGDVGWVVGGDGDLAVAGDFDCDGWLEVASLTAQGQVAVFDRWAGGGQEPAGRVIEQIPAARTIASAARERCHDLVVERTDLPSLTLVLGPDS